MGKYSQTLINKLISAKMAAGFTKAKINDEFLYESDEKHAPQYVRRSRMMKKTAVLLLCCLLIFCSCREQPAQTTVQMPDELPEMQICFFDVGKADCILISCGGENMIIDAGYKSSKAKIKDELKARGIKKIDTAVATHNHKDHIGAMAFVIEKYDVKTLYVSQTESDTDVYSDMK